MDGNLQLAKALKDLGINLSRLVAATALWADKQVFERLLRENGLGVWYLATQRYKVGNGEQFGQTIDGVYLDKNNYAGAAIRQAIGLNRVIKNYHACHIWPLTSYDHRYHTCVANIVMLPKVIAGISDHDQTTIDSLKYRSFELYGWHPKEEVEPIRPVGYPDNWLEPLPYTKTIEGSIDRRRIRKLA